MASLWVPGLCLEPFRPVQALRGEPCRFHDLWDFLSSRHQGKRRGHTRGKNNQQSNDHCKKRGRLVVVYKVHPDVRVARYISESLDILLVSSALQLGRRRLQMDGRVICIEA